MFHIYFDLKFFENLSFSKVSVSLSLFGNAEITMKYVVKRFLVKLFVLIFDFC